MELFDYIEVFYSNQRRRHSTLDTYASADYQALLDAA